MIAFCDYCQKNTLSVSVKGSPDAICSCCGQAHSVQFSHLRSVPQKLSPEEAKLETQKYLSPELLASLQDDTPVSSDDPAAKETGEQREKKIIEEIESLEKAVKNLVHKSRPGVPKPKAMKTRPVKQQASSSKSNVQNLSNEGSDRPRQVTEREFAAGSKLGDLQLRVDLGHVPQAELGKAVGKEPVVRQEIQGVNATVIADPESPTTNILRDRSFGLQLSSLAISLSWCIQLLLGISYFSVMPAVFGWFWMVAQAIGTASLGYILACQIWDTDRQQPVEGESQPPQQPAFSRSRRSQIRSSKLV